LQQLGPNDAVSVSANIASIDSRSAATLWRRLTNETRLGDNAYVVTRSCMSLCTGFRAKCAQFMGRS